MPGPSETMGFTRLEEALISWFRDRCETVIARQLRDAPMNSRNHTGVGLFVHLPYRDQPEGITRPPFDCDVIPGPDIVSRELPSGASSALLITDGVPDALEVFSYGDAFPIELSEFSLD